MTVTLSRDQVVRWRARLNHLDRMLPADSFAEASWLGFQDSVPRSGVLSLNARVEDTRPDSWEHPSVAQIWFRGGADYIVPRADVGVFTLGSYPRDPELAGRLERLADRVDRVAGGETLPVGEVTDRLGLDHQTHIRSVAVTGRVLIRWNASRIWLIPIPRPAIDADDARRELARRFLHGFGPSTVKRLTTWTGVSPADASATWREIESELVEVELAGERRWMLGADVDDARAATPIQGVRLLPFDDAFTKLDRELLVPDETRRPLAFPPVGTSNGYAPGVILVDGEIVGTWGRQQRKVTMLPWSKLSGAVRDEIDRQALAFPIAGTSKPSVRWT